jgi:hypothetical protein
MESIMKRLFPLIAVLGLLLGSVGCSSNSKVTLDRTITGPELNSYLITHEAQIRVSARLITRGYMITRVKPANVERFKATTYATATNILKLLAQDPPVISNLGNIVAEQLGESAAPEDKLVIQELVAEAQDVVNQFIGSTYKNLSASDQAKAAQALLRGVASGIQDATKPDAPTSAPVAMTPVFWKV